MESNENKAKARADYTKAIEEAKAKTKARNMALRTKAQADRAEADRAEANKAEADRAEANKAEADKAEEHDYSFMGKNPNCTVNDVDFLIMDQQIKNKIQETKMTCAACGNIWFYGKSEELKNFSNNMNAAGTSLLCCSGCLPALFCLPFVGNNPDINTCKKCGSKATKKEIVTHEV